MSLRPRVVLATLAHESLPIVVCSAFLALLAALVPQLLSSDGWLALVSGRLIAHHGLPHHDSLAALTYGRDWVDQQWFGQLATYAIEAVGGVRLLLAINVLLVGGAFIAAAVYARRRGARPATVSVILFAALLPFLVTAMNVRTQSFVYLPFVVLVGALARDRPLSVRAAGVVLAVIVVWANVHGSALLAAGVVALRGAIDLYRPPRSRIAWALLIGPWPCLLASPYHVHLLSYYGKTAFNSSFSTYLSQWAPTTFSLVAAPLLVLVFATVWMLGRAAPAYTTYETWLAGASALLALLAVRNWAFASLLLVMFTPHGFDLALRKKAARPAPPIGAVVAALAALAAVASVVGSLSSATPDLTQNYPAEAARAAAAAASGRDAQVYAGIPFADWLLWTHPELTGKVVLDVRYELLKASEVKRLALFDAGNTATARLGSPVAYVLDPDTESHAVKGLSPDVRTVYNTDHAVIAVVRNGE